MELDPKLKSEIKLKYSRSSGPGGQSVNKLNTKVHLHWDVFASRFLPEDVKTRFLMRFGSRINHHGELVLSAQSHRELKRNVSECLSKLAKMIATAWIRPKARVATTPRKMAKEKRLISKKVVSDKKRMRKKIDPSET